MSKYPRKMRRKAEQEDVYTQAANKIVNATWYILKNRFGRLRRKDTRLERYLDMLTKVLKGEEI